ncbi:Anthocyanidin 3-O-glucoside 5-O-glucosyltransferase 1 [Spatholobus suberectus]|nr:Anthocyanidin 3-O-glucoside 5-O-glucosyltransferase 1 [Spatholobus suberectus]
MVLQRFLVVTYPAQSHINPALQLAKRLITMGAHVTLLVTLHLYRRIANKITIPGLSLLPFSDGYDAGLSFSLSPRDIPSFLLLWKPSLLSFVLPSFEAQIKQLDLEANPTEEKSVVYVSFGSYLELSKRQMEEIARALLDCGCPFLWVIREKVKSNDQGQISNDINGSEVHISNDENNGQQTLGGHRRVQTGRRTLYKHGSRKRKAMMCIGKTVRNDACNYGVIPHLNGGTQWCDLLQNVMKNGSGPSG